MSKYLTRKELYDLVWSEVTTLISDQLNISTYRLQKICKENRIPVASPDYWTMEMLENTTKPVLPVGEDLPADMMIEIVSDQAMNMRKLNERRQAIERDCKDYLIVPKILFDPESLITAAKCTLEKGENYEYGRKDGFRTTKEGQIHISVTKKHINRALRILDTFIKLVRARNHSIELNGLNYQIRINDERHEFSIREKQERVESTHKDYAYVDKSTGILVLTVGRYHRKREFFDGIEPLERKLSSAVAYLEYLTEHWRKILAEQDAMNKEIDTKEKVLLEIRKRHDYELRSFKDLLTQANLFHQSKIIREYINAVEIKAQQGVNSDDLNKWIEWAKSKVDWYDPLKNREDEILSKEDKVKFTNNE